MKKRNQLLLVVLILIAAILFVASVYGKTFFSQKDSLYLEVANTNSPAYDQAAVVLLALPAKSNFSVGEIVNISLKINTTGQSINAVAGNITFPEDKLEVASTSIDNSIISIWAKEPSLNDERNKINFAGAILPPGYKGPSGQVLNISFKVKSVGAAIVSIKDAQILANDGRGTNIAADISPAKLTLIPPTNINHEYDLSSDGKVDLTDLSILVSKFMTSGNSQFDFNGDNTTDLIDLSILVSKFGQK